jgi:hypothetical protein
VSGTVAQASCSKALSNSSLDPVSPDFLVSLECRGKGFYEALLQLSVSLSKLLHSPCLLSESGY